MRGNIKRQSRLESQIAGERREREEPELRFARKRIAAPASGEAMPIERKQLNAALRGFLCDGESKGLDELCETKAMSVGSNPQGG